LSRRLRVAATLREVSTRAASFRATSGSGSGIPWSGHHSRPGSRSGSNRPAHTRAEFDNAVDPQRVARHPCRILRKRHRPARHPALVANRLSHRVIATRRRRPASIDMGWHGSWNRTGHVRIEHSSGPVRPIARAGTQPRTPPPFREAFDHEQSQQQPAEPAVRRSGTFGLPHRVHAAGPGEFIVRPGLRSRRDARQRLPALRARDRSRRRGDGPSHSTRQLPTAEGTRP
jgi:hypothetical protein